MEKVEGIAPTFQQKPKYQNVDERTNVVFEGRVVALPEPEIVWLRDGVKIEPTDRHRVTINKDVHMYHVSLEIDSATPEDAGNYEVIATNEHGEATVKVSLVVKGMSAQVAPFSEHLNIISSEYHHIARI